MRDFGIDFERELNADQLAAVCAPWDRPALVLAGAGSGKTRTLTYRVAWLLSEFEFKPREILLLTFTNKAANQMLDRISALTGFSSREFWGGTFHSMGNKFLRIEGKAIGIEPDFAILDMDDSDAFLKRCVEEEYPKFFSVKDNPRVRLLREIISYARNTCKSVPEAMQERFAWIETPAEQIADIAKFYDFDKRRKNYCDFDDLLEQWLKLLQESPQVLQKYSSRFANILVDEYQDTNLLQSEILDLLAQRGNISAVGDDAQCIYSWRGAEIDNILRFKERYPAASIYKIEKNYRSTSEILDFANAVLQTMPSSDDYRKTLVPARRGGEKPLLIRALDGASQGRQIADCVRDVVGGGKYEYSDIAILYRSHFQAMDMQLQMQYKNIPFVITSGLKFFEQAHVKDIVAMIKFANSPRDFMSFLRVLKFLPKVGEKTAEKIHATISAVAEKTGQGFISAMKDKIVEKKIPTAARELFLDLADSFATLEKMRVIAQEERSKIFAEEPEENGDEVQAELFFDSPDKREESQEKSESKIIPPAEIAEILGRVAPRMATDAIALAEATKPKKREPFLIPDKPTPKDFVKAACSGWYADMMKVAYSDWEERFGDFDALYEYAGRFSTLEEFLDNAALEIGEKPATKEDGESINRVRLMTVHQAKGLEFPVVFLIGAADGMFPTKRSIDDGDVEEERRLFYVASTRAMDWLIISYPAVNAVNGDFQTRPPSRFLSDVSPELYQMSR